MAARPGAERPPQSWRIAVVGGALVLAALYWMGGAGTAPGGQGACGRGVGAPPLPELKKRTDLARVLEERGFKTGAELGVQRGIFSERILTDWPSCEKYYLVDIWKQQTNYKDGANVDDNAQERIFNIANERLEPFSAPVFMRMFTSEAAKLIPDNSLDFVYVDARHDYCGAKEDMELYWPKLRRGGIMAGHDFVTAETVARWTNGTEDWSLCADGTKHPGAVRGAAEEFAAAKGVDLVITGDGPPSFAFVKPC